MGCSNGGGSKGKRPMRKPKERARVKPAMAKRRDMIEWADGEEGYKTEGGGAVLHKGQ